jgi:hypothetical protein
LVTIKISHLSGKNKNLQKHSETWAQILDFQVKNNFCCYLQVFNFNWLCIPTANFVLNLGKFTLIFALQVESSNPQHFWWFLFFSCLSQVEDSELEVLSFFCVAVMQKQI